MNPEKGSISSRVLTTFAVAIIGGVIISSMTAGVMGVAVGDEGGLGGILDMISTMTGSATIGEEAEPAEAREQFRQLVAFNSLAAQQCSILAQVAMSNNIGTMDTEELSDNLEGDAWQSPEDFEELQDHIPENLGANPEDLEELEDREEAYITWLTENPEENPFGLIGDTNFHGKCFGARLDIDIGKGLVDIAGVPESVQNAAGNIKSGVLSQYGYDGDDDPPPFKGDDWDGGSMQGKPGRINFNAEQNFTIRDPRLMKLHLGPEFENEDAPGHWRGANPAVFHPNIDFASYAQDVEDDMDNVIKDPDLGDRIGNIGGDLWGGAKDIFGEGQPLPHVWAVRANVKLFNVVGNKLYGDGGNEYPERRWAANQIVMKNVPTFGSIETDSSNIESMKASDLDIDADIDSDYLAQNILNSEFLAHSRNNMAYVFCEGSEGYIQTNVGDPGNSGDADHETYGSPVWRDVPFTKVKITNPEPAQLWKEKKCIDIPENLWDRPGSDYGSSLTYIPEHWGSNQLNTEHCSGDISSFVTEEKVETSPDYESVPIGYNSTGDKVSMEVACGWRQRYLRELAKKVGLNPSWGGNQILYNREIVVPEEDEEGNNQNFDEGHDISSLADTTTHSGDGSFTPQLVPDYYLGREYEYPVLFMDNTGKAEYPVEQFDGTNFFVGIKRGTGDLEDSIGENDNISVKFETHRDDFKLTWKPSDKSISLDIEEADGDDLGSNSHTYELENEDLEMVMVGLTSDGEIYYSTRYLDSEIGYSSTTDLTTSSLEEDYEQFMDLEEYEGQSVVKTPNQCSQGRCFIEPDKQHVVNPEDNDNLDIGRVEEITIEKTVGAGIEDRASILALGNPAGGS